MTKSITAALAATFTIMFGACSSSGSQTTETTEKDSLAIAVDNSIDNDTKFQQMLRQFPEEKRAEIIERHKANGILLKYLRLKDRRYYFDITEKEAEKLGVKPQYYQQSVADVEATNRSIAEQDALGNKMELPDPQDMIKQTIDNNLQ